MANIVNTVLTKSRLTMAAAAFALCLVVVGAVAPIPALAQVPQEPETDLGGAHIVGYITDISGAVVLVEEDPSTSPSPYQSPYELGEKGAFTVSEETSILRQQGEELIPAAFEDLEVGQLVAATYVGRVLESYPSQGDAARITILEEPSRGDPSGEVTATGVLESTAQHGQDPEPVYALTDETSGTPYELISGFVDLEPYVGKRIAISGVTVPGPGTPGSPHLLNVTQAQLADNPGNGNMY